MNKVYTAYIEELIKVDGEITLELRIRIPQIHGLKGQTLIKTKDLPIAKPLLIPGMIIDKKKFENYLAIANTVQVISKDKNYQTIYYLGFPITGNDIIKIDEAEGGRF